MEISPTAWQPHCELWTLEQLNYEHSIILGMLINHSTSTIYSSTLNLYLTFCKSHGLPVDPTPKTLSYYITFQSFYINPNQSILTSLESATSSNHSFQTCTKTKNPPSWITPWQAQNVITPHPHTGSLHWLLQTSSPLQRTWPVQPCTMISCSMLNWTQDLLGYYTWEKWPCPTMCPSETTKRLPCVFHGMDPRHILILVADPQSWHNLWRELDCNQENNWCTQPSPHHGSVHQILWYTLPFPPTTVP